MASIRSPFPASAALCAGCAVRPADTRQALCSFCQSQLLQHLTWARVWRTGGRWCLTSCLEGLLGLFAGFLLLMPIGAASSENLSLIAVVIMFLVYLAFMLPIFVAVYAWTVRPCIVRAWVWAWGKAGAALGPCCLLLAGIVLGGVRLDSVPAWPLLGSVIVAQAGGGMGVALWQQRLLPAPQHQAAMWMRWNLLAWIIAGCVHITIGLLGGTKNGIGLWFGTAAAYLSVGMITQGVVAWFALKAHLVRHVHAQSPQV